MDADYTSFPRVPLEAVRLLWICDYNDMTLSGMLVYQGRIRWYQLCDYARETDMYRYAIHELTDIEANEEQSWLSLFQEHVGDHSADDQTGVRPSSEHAKFYGPYGKRNRPDYSTRPVIGWFEM